MCKKQQILAVIAVCTCLLAGCGNDEHVIKGDSSNPASTGNSSGQTSTSGQDQQGGMGQSGATAGYTFVSNGVTLPVDADAAALVEALGEPKTYFEAASCAFEGLDKFYTYSGFEIDTYPLDNKDYISLIILKDDSVTTPEGAAIGISKDDVIKTYGSDHQEQGDLIIYEKGGMKLCFIIQNGSVASIEYRSCILDE